MESSQSLKTGGFYRLFSQYLITWSLKLDKLFSLVINESMTDTTWNNTRILVVEDDEDMLNILCEFLQIHGAVVSAAPNGKAGMALVDTQEFDLVISDIQMPLMNGLDLLKYIRSKNQLSPVVFLASGHSNVDEKTALANGASALIPKPFNLNLLLENMKKFVKKT